MADPPKSAIFAPLFNRSTFDAFALATPTMLDRFAPLTRIPAKSPTGETRLSATPKMAFRK
jgi:hypothetical protein